MTLFERILAARGIDPAAWHDIAHPRYEALHDPFLLPDMREAVERLVRARDLQERIVIYGDYDIDGLTATTVLVEAFRAFGFTQVRTYMPNRFVEGYGLTIDAVEKIHAEGADLIVTVDCGSISHAEISRAVELGLEVIVTDHHNVAKVQPPAVAVINPKRLLDEHPDAYDHYVKKPDADEGLYPFLDLAGVGVAYKLVCALQTALPGLAQGQEKWLLDLVALGTVCDVVTLRDENRTIVYWGLEVLKKTRRPGLRALMNVAAVKPDQLNTRSLGFGLGPRMNASGRLETAQYALSMLLSDDATQAVTLARQLDDMNKTRRKEQAEILKEALLAARDYADDPVLVVYGEGWNHGIVGIVAAKLLELYKKPVFVLAGHEGIAKGSARSFGEFSAAQAIRAADDIIVKGGGHALAAGVTIDPSQIGAFRTRVNEYYRSLQLRPQEALLLPTADTDAVFAEITHDLLAQLDALEPYGKGNEQPVLCTRQATVRRIRKMGDNGQHLRFTFEDTQGTAYDLLAFSAPAHFYVEPGTVADIWYTPERNEWQGRISLEGRLVHLAV